MELCLQALLQFYNDNDQPGKARKIQTVARQLINMPLTSDNPATGQLGASRYNKSL